MKKITLRTMTATEQYIAEEQQRIFAAWNPDRKETQQEQEADDAMLAHMLTVIERIATNEDEELERCAFGNVLVNPWKDVIGNIHCKCDECLAEDERIARIESPNDFIDEPTSYYDDEEDEEEWDDDYDEAYFDDCEDDDMED